VDAQFACVDFAEESARAQGQASHATVDEAAYADCLRELVSTDQLRAAVIDTLTGVWDSTAVARLSEAQQTCAAEAA
jgi:hypothetical protein